MIKNKYIKNTLLYIIGIFLIAFIFQIISWVINNDYFFPNILDVIKSFFVELGESKTWLGILNTTKNVILTIIFSFVIGIILAILAYKFNFIYYILKPLMMIFRFIPIVIIINLLFYIFYNNDDAILYISVSTFLTPMVYESIYQGIKGIDPIYIDVYKLNSNFNLKILFRVYLPLCISNCKSAFLNAIGIGIKICLSVEFMCSLRKSLGYLIKYEINTFEGFDRLYGYMIILIILSIILELIPILISKLYIKLKYERYKINEQQNQD